MDDLLLCQPSKNNTDVLAGLSRKTTTDYDDSTTLYSQVRVYWADRGTFMLTKLFCAFGLAIHRPAVTFWVKLETVQGLYFIISFVGLLSLKEGTCFTISKTGQKSDQNQIKKLRTGPLLCLPKNMANSMQMTPPCICWTGRTVPARTSTSWWHFDPSSCQTGATVQRWSDPADLSLTCPVWLA